MSHLKPNLKMLCFAMAILSRKEEKKSLLPRLLYFTAFCKKAIQWPLNVYIHIFYSLKLHSQQSFSGIGRFSPCFVCTSVSWFQISRCTILYSTFFFFKGTWPSVSRTALKAAPLFCKRRRSLLTNLALSQALENTGRVWGISPPLNYYCYY